MIIYGRQEENSTVGEEEEELVEAMMMMMMGLSLSLSNNMTLCRRDR